MAVQVLHVWEELRYLSLGNRCSLIEFLGTDQEMVRGPLDDLGNGSGPGIAASRPDGGGEADEILGQDHWIATRIEAFPGAIGEVGRPPAFEGLRRQRQGTLNGGRPEPSLGRHREHGRACRAGRLGGSPVSCGCPNTT